MHAADLAARSTRGSDARSARRSAPPGRATPRASCRCRRPARSRSPRRARAPRRWPAAAAASSPASRRVLTSDWRPNCSSTSAPMSRATLDVARPRAHPGLGVPQLHRGDRAGPRAGEPEPAADVRVDLQGEHGVQRAPQRRRARRVPLRHAQRERVHEQVDRSRLLPVGAGAARAASAASRKRFRPGPHRRAERLEVRGARRVRASSESKRRAALTSSRAASPTRRWSKAISPRSCSISAACSASTGPASIAISSSSAASSAPASRLARAAASSRRARSRGSRG